MTNEHGYRTVLALFAVVVIIATIVAFVTTLERVDKRTANNETAPGATGLAKARPPLDRAPGQPVTTGNALSASPDNRK
jgi:Na+/melibiose symporter-like transporter